MLEAVVRAVGEHVLAVSQLRDLPQPGELLGVDDGHETRMKSHRSMDAECVF